MNKNIQSPMLRSVSSDAAIEGNFKQTKERALALYFFMPNIARQLLVSRPSSLTTSMNTPTVMGL